MFSVVIALTIAAVIGYTAQVTGLCMVRGVNDWIRGRRLRLTAILMAGFWIYLFTPLMVYQNHSFLAVYPFHWSIPLGGFVFGLGAAINGACSISTATRLSSGDLRMVLTMLGWLAGWVVLIMADVEPDPRRTTYQLGFLPWFAVASLVLASILVYWKFHYRWRMWSGIMVVGIFAGALFLYEPAWSPSDFVRDAGLNLMTAASPPPSFLRALILFTMLLGMTVGAWRFGRFRWVLPADGETGKHLGGGVLMGAGSALALGGNDFQLLLALPALSLASMSALAGMLAGIWLGIRKPWKDRGLLSWRS
ncbi:YeeE/YedE thiosulfate transporter family protein [Marinobacter sp.]|uniref:YeeE/YedE thiosulfate transporter family protein n=1 Tax=Marinobacter sp. TaxID=50741 RepID=UPI0019E828F0|nr:YeeE/YedE thiosulfate transporter family protein [Marinobacter sp.]MBE0486894.1 YeeE/YedE family protein [Marinobacter sp.]